VASKFLPCVTIEAPHDRSSRGSCLRCRGVRAYDIVVCVQPWGMRASDAARSPARISPSVVELNGFRAGRARSGGLCPTNEFVGPGRNMLGYFAFSVPPVSSGVGGWGV